MHADAHAHALLLPLPPHKQGPVPREWGAMPLTDAYLYDNAGLTGCLPAPWRASLVARDVDFLQEGTEISGFCK